MSGTRDTTQHDRDGCNYEDDSDDEDDEDDVKRMKAAMFGVLFPVILGSNSACLASIPTYSNLNYERYTTEMDVRRRQRR
jgi:hypothetical protein